MTRSISRTQSRPLVSADDDPLFSADDCTVNPGVVARRASLTVADVTAIADGTMWAVTGEVPA